MHASIQGGLWALFLSSTGLAFASVVDEASRDLPVQIAVQTDAPGPLTLVDVPTVAMAAAPEASTVVASLSPATLTSVAPDSFQSVGLSTVPPATLAQLGVVLDQPRQSAAPQRPQMHADSQLIFANMIAPSAPAGPFAPMIVTRPVPPSLPERPVVVQSRNAAPAGNLIVRVQALGGGTGGTITNRLPQIALPTPEAEAPPVVETAPAPDPAQDVTPAPAPQPVLPSLGDAPTNQLVPLNPGAGLAPDNTAPAPDDVVAAPAVENSEDLPALQRYAATFENVDNLPVLGILLVDDGSATTGPSLMFESGLKATIAVSALTEDAALFAEAYREAGMEVALQVPLPDGATPVDVEVAFAAAFDILPEAAMLYSNGHGVLRNNRQAAAQVMEILAADGRGFVTFSSGLGGPLRAAEAANVPVATVVRDLDDAGGDTNAIIRTLDRAAFEARRGRGAIVTARLTPEILAILQAWSSAGVAIGPASAIMIAPVAEAPVAQNSLPQIEANVTAPETTTQATAAEQDTQRPTETEEDE